MNKKLQLKLLVTFSLIVVIVVYLYVNKGFSFSFQENWQDVKNYFKSNTSEIFDSESIENLQSSFNTLKDNIKEQGEEDNSIDKNLIAQRLLEKISSIKNIVYEYEPWNIKFDYPENMSKQVDLTTQKINLYYEDFQNLDVIIKKIDLESSFNDWLNNNYDLQELGKEEYNDLTFWVRDLSNEEYLKKEYYVNLGEEVFTIVLESPRDQEGYWNHLENIVKSFKQINL